jgi:superfamily II RNA helicase
MSYFNKVDITKKVDIPEHTYSFPLDPFQQHAIRIIANNENILACLSTGSGKTLVGEYQIYHSLKKGKRVFYTTPIKSLSNQKFYDLKHQFTEASVGILTGDIKFCPDAQIVIMTTEILRNLLYKKGSTTEHLGLTATISLDNVDAVIFDECHYMNDKDRGMIWEETMILLPPEINMVMLSATLDHPEYVGEWLGQLKKKPVHLIETQYRIVPLSHHLIIVDPITEEYKLVTLQDAREQFYPKVYTDWLKARKNLRDAAYKQAQDIKDNKKPQQKIHVDSFKYQMNQTIVMLEKKNLLPAICFVLSRKGCEQYARTVDKDLLTSSDTAAVKHIISFHLHRHLAELETIPQYHQIYNLLCRGIAFHHSGLLPLLKEIVEILFSKGFIKLLFCTETFAVGLNMPTKTVLFTGFKKYDETLGDMRLLRNDEYIQMAGRAGRRGKDDKGIVIYLPDREPVEPHEIHEMMKGAKPPITSKMTFHYDFILKTIQASTEPLKWLEIMKQSYWYQQRQFDIKTFIAEKEQIESQAVQIQLNPCFPECKQRYTLEAKMKTHSNKKEIQRELTTLKNKQLGPKWIMAWKEYQEYETLITRCLNLEERIQELADYESVVKEHIQFLYEIGYLLNADPYTITKRDLSVKGILATEVNEGHPILMSELYCSGQLHGLSGNDLLTVLACFHEKKMTVPISELQISQESYDCLVKIQKMVDEFYGMDKTDYWQISTEMIEPISRWIQGEHTSVLCQDYELFEGNMMRSILKIGAILEEWLTMAVYCQHTEQIDKIMELKERMKTTQADSLYLRLSA